MMYTMSWFFIVVFRTVFALKTLRALSSLRGLTTFAVRETASLGIMGAPRVPPLNPSETIVLSNDEHIGCRKLGEIKI